ncbi:hypothetical protein VNO78_21247 [Psophocarpus tetragonolobus]|uniref:Uncharacterized protein n=1 Tax=Psophocarpus tetragonolobus TaxID=3891 RepID=A0AAN9XHX6_PSOTE
MVGVAPFFTIQFSIFTFTFFCPNPNLTTPNPTPHLFIYVSAEFGVRGFADAGDRTPCLSHAKRALYHLSYIPIFTISVSPLLVLRFKPGSVRLRQLLSPPATAHSVTANVNLAVSQEEVKQQR